MIVNLIDEYGRKSSIEILFWKTPLEKRRRKHGRELIDTTCKIFDTFQSLVATGIAKQNVLDRYNKIIGKKIALTRAINKLQCLRSTGCSVEASNTRWQMRQQIWTEFHKTFGKWS